MDFWLYAAVFCTAVLSAMGVGGGTLLLAFLAVFSDFSGPEIRFINLFLFLPVAALSLFIHTRSGLVDWKAVLLALPGGLAGAFLGAWLAARTDRVLFTRLFALFLMAVGLKELFSGRSEEHRPHRSDDMHAGSAL